MWNEDRIKTEASSPPLLIGYCAIDAAREDSDEIAMVAEGNRGTEFRPPIGEMIK